MTQRFIKPARAGLVVRRPDNGKPLPDEGLSVEWGTYWQRRLDDQDVIEVDQVQAQPKQEPVTAVVEPDKKGGSK